MGNSDELFDIFVKELEEHLEVLESSLLEIEAHLDAPDKDVVNSILRACHSMKGACGFFGYDNIGKLSHAMENVFEKIRDNALQPDTAFMEVMLASLDALKGALADLEGSKDRDFFGEIERIGAFLTQDETSALETAAIPKPAVPAEDPALDHDAVPAPQVFTVKPGDADEAIRFGRGIYSLNIDVRADIFDQGLAPKAFIETVQSISTILDSDPEIKIIRSMRKNTRTTAVSLLITTVIDQDLLADALGVNAAAIMPVDLAPFRAPVPPAEPDDEPEERSGSSSAAPAPTVSTRREVLAAPHQSGTLRVRTALLNEVMKIAGELVLERNQLLDKVDKLAVKNDELTDTVQNISRITTELQSRVIQTRMQPLDVVFKRFPRLVRDTSRLLAKKIDLVTEGGDVELDSSIIEHISDPLVHLIRNACDHGIESPEERHAAGKPVMGTLRIAACYEGEHVNIDIYDDGRGMNIDAIKSKAVERKLVADDEVERMSRGEILSFVFTPGFSTAVKVSSLSGRGVGMDVVAENTSRLGGSVAIEASSAEGTHIRMKLPLTLAIISSLIVEAENQKFALLQADIVELLKVRPDNPLAKIRKIRGVPVLIRHDELIPLVRLADILELPRTFVHPVTGKRLPDRRGTIADRRGIDMLDQLEEHDPETEYSEKRSRSDRRDFQKYLIVVVRYRSKFFGLIVDGKDDIQEMVVKPLPRFLASGSFYSGVSILGDGRVILILDVQGLAAKAGLRFGDAERLKERQRELRAVTEEVYREAQDVLLVKIKSGERIGIPLECIRRIEELADNRIQNVGGQEYTEQEGRNLRLVRLEDFVPSTDAGFRKSINWILIPRIDTPLGFMVNEVVDTLHIPVDLERESLQHPNLLGSAMIDGQVVLFLDIYAVLDSVFTGRRPVLNGHDKVYTILLVDTIPFYRTVALYYLDHQRIRVTSVDSVAAALAVLEKTAYDLVLCRTRAPRLDGYMFLNEVRSSSRLKNIPIMGLTTLSEVDEVERAVTAGFDACEVSLNRDRFLKKAFGLLER